MIGIIIAMKTEAPSLIKKHFSDSFIHSVKKTKFHVIKTLSGHLAVLGFAGIGKVNVATLTALMINTFNVKACFNIGSCGIVNDLQINELLLVEHTCYCDVDVSAFGYEMNQIPQMPTIFSTDHTLNEIVTGILKSSNLEYKSGICHTSDSFINIKNYQKFNLIEKNMPAVCDMECAAIAQTCYVLNIPFCAVKVGVDKLHEPESNQIQFKKNLELIAQTVELVAANCIQALSYNIPGDDIKDEIMPENSN